MPVAAARRSRAELHERLEERLGEIEQTILTRAHSLADPSEVGDPAYSEGLRAAVAAGLRYGLSGIEGQRPSEAPIPPELINQARLAARSGVPLETVLRRYFAGYTLLGDFVVGEAKKGVLDPAELRLVLRTQAELFDRLIAVVSEEHRAQTQARERAPSAEQRKARCVERLLAGELADTAQLGYRLGGWHLGVVAASPGAARAIRELGGALERQVLILPREEAMTWAWLGGRHRIEMGGLNCLISPPREQEVTLAFGEPAQGPAGWRLSHRQALAAFPIALQGAQPLTFYEDVAMLASIVRDELLVTSLRDRYLVPLVEERPAVRHTLRAYFAAGRNVSSTAAALGVSRNTVASRLRRVEVRIGRALGSCETQIEAALELEDLGLSVS